MLRLRTLITTGIALALLGLFSLAAIQLAARNRADETPQFVLDRPLRIDAVGHDFQWEFRYPGPDGELGTDDDVQSRQELILPLDANIKLSLKSEDFIYTFSSPELGLKEIAVPELMFSLEFHTSQMGTFDLPSDPMCGLRFFHDDSMGTLTVQSLSEFADWYTFKAKN